jgi:Flp pilus assembly protein TadD
VDVNPDSGGARRNLAMALWATRSLGEAEVHARRAAALQPGDAGSHDLLGRVLLQQGRLDEAAAELERALRLDPTLADARDALNHVRTLLKSGAVAQGRR